MICDALHDAVRLSHCLIKGLEAFSQVLQVSVALGEIDRVEQTRRVSPAVVASFYLQQEVQGMGLTADVHKEWILCLQFCHSSLVRTVKLADKAQTSKVRSHCSFSYTCSHVWLHRYILQREHNTE